MDLLQTLSLAVFLPHGTCYLWNPRIVWLHVISDGIIALSYYCIPVALLYLSRQRRDIPFNWIFWMFAAFIFGCGTTHIMEVWTVWSPAYVLSGVLKAVTAAISLATAVMLVPLVPKVIALPGPRHFEAINRKLQHEIKLSAQRERELVNLSDRLDHRVQERTAELESINRSLEKQIALGIETQRALRSSEARLSGVIECAMDAILTVDEQQKIVLFNGAAEEVFACDATNAIGRPLEIFIPQRVREAHREHIKHFGATGATSRHMGAMGELWAMRADGTEFPIEASISQTEAGGRRLFTVILRDITDRKEAETRKLRLAAIVESSDRAIISKDLSGTILSWNHAAEQLYGYLEAEVVGKSISIIIPPESKQELRLFLTEVAEGRVVNRHETSRLRKDGSRVDVSLIISPLRNSQGQIIGASTIASDISERKRTQDIIYKLNQELEQRVHERTAELQATNKELEAFTYSVSHDLRAPLRHIAGFSNMIAEEYSESLPTEARHYLQRIQDGIRRMGQLVDDLLSLTRIGRHELRAQVTGIESIVKDVIAELAPDLEKREVEWKVGELPYVEADPALLRVVFQNLLANAVKYTRPRQKAVIEVGKTEIDGQQFMFVRDNGVGFDMKYADKLFGVFQRLHRSEDFEGTGVGLAIVQRVVQKHGGRIWAEAELDKGATFYFDVKAAPAKTPGKKLALAGGAL